MKKSNNYIHHAQYLRNSIAYDISRHFFHFFRILIFWVVSGVKRQKMVQNEKKICLSRSISQEPYIIWFLFMIHMCKMMISSGLFFKILIFRVVRRVRRQKMAPNDKKLYCLYISGIIDHMIFIYGTHV